MDIPFITTDANQPMEIVSIENKNNKTITVILSQPFTGNETFEILETDNPLSEVLVMITDDSVNPEDNKKVIVADTRFQTGINYTLKISENTKVISAQFTIDSNLPKPSNATVTAIGKRILNIQFQIPVKNLDRILQNNTLANFYMLFFNYDSNYSLNEKPQWLGLLNASTDDPTATVDPNTELTVRRSEDYKSLELQMNKRDFPIGKSSLIIDYSKAQTTDQSYHLHDFSDDAVVVPSMKKQFNVLNDEITAIVTDVKALDRTNLIVKFNKAVLKKFNEKNIISVNGVVIKTSKVLRLGNQFNELQFVLSTPLPVGLISVTVGRITDANGYLTNNTLFKDVKVPAVPPRVIDVNQYGSSQIKISVTFSKEMKNTIDIGGVRNTDYYSISKLDGRFVKPINPIRYNVDTKTVILELAGELLEGKHTIQISKVQDIYGLPMLPQEINFGIINTTIPVVESVTYREFSGSCTTKCEDKTIIVVKYDQAMASTGEHSIGNVENYLVEYNPLPYNSTASIMHDAKWVRLTLNGDAPVLPLSNDSNNYSKINIGYPKVKEIHYVENINGNIYPICKVKDIIGPLESLNISKGICTILTSEVLEYKYEGKNEFLNLSIDDYRIISDNVEIFPLSIHLINEKTIHFIFEQNTFNGSSTSVFIATKADKLHSTDVFGLPIEPNQTSSVAKNGLRAGIDAISLITDSSSSAILRIAFNKEIAVFDIGDFVCTLNDTEILPISSATILESNKKIVEANVKLTRPLLMVDVHKMELAVNPDYIRTLDVNGNKIAEFAPVEITSFVAEEITWFADLANTKPIAGSIIELDLNYTIELAQSGTSIPENTLTFKKGATANDPDTITLDYDNTLGTIELFNNGSPIIDSDVTNNKPVSLDLIDGKKIRFTFATDENAAVSLGNIQSINYTPYINPTNNNTLVDKTGTRFLYANYKPTGSISNV